MRFVKRTKMRTRVQFHSFLTLGGIAIMCVLMMMNASDPRDRSAINREVSVLKGRMLSNDTSSSDSTTVSLVPECSDTTKPGYMTELFTCEAKKQGATVFYVLGVMYMFIGLSIVCDEFFVPALEGFVDAFGISDDVAGATFMAAGGSAPELFTSFIGVFIAKSSVGFGTIVGSAVFNVLFVIGMCAIFSREVLELTWWPLFRDCSYYTVSLIVLAVFFGGDYGAGKNKIELWESIVLLCMYAGYVLLMKYNEVIHQKLLGFMKSSKTAPEGVKPPATEDSEDLHPFKRKHKSKRQTGVNIMARPTKFRAGIMQMVFSAGAEDVVKRARSFVVSELIGDVDETFAQIDQNGDEKIDRSELTALLTELTGTPPLDADIDAALDDMQIDKTGEVSKEEFIQWYKQSEVMILKQVKDAYEKIDSDDDGRIDKFELKQVLQNIGTGEKMSADEAEKEVGQIMLQFGKKVNGEEDLSLPFESFHDWYVNSTIFEAECKAQEKRAAEGTNGDGGAGGGDDEEGEPLSLEIPKGGWKALVPYIICFPLCATLVLTVPDVRKPKFKNLYAVAFVMSIVWIGIYSYFMVWWAEVIGIMAGIPDTVMGLTFLAAGTSIPDLLSSVIVARQGLGDMAVSSSVGSNIFDILMGLPIPWFFYSVSNGTPMTVTAGGLLTSVLILILMLVAVVATIALSGWKMTKTLGGIMFLLYFLFLGQDLLRAFDIIQFNM